MKLLEDYVDALLDGSALVPRFDAPRFDGARRDGDLHVLAPRARAVAATKPADALLDVAAEMTLAVDTGVMPSTAANPAPLYAFDRARGNACEPASRVPPAPTPTPAFLPAFVPGAPEPEAVGADAHAAGRPSATTSMATSHRWLRVKVGHDSYGLELLRVQEVARLAPIVALRGVARAVLGVMNLRGRIVPVVDLGLWLAAGCVHGDECSRIVVVERDDEMIGVLVSAVEDVVTLGRERIEPPLASSDPGAVVGIARVGAAPTVLLDANALFG